MWREGLGAYSILTNNKTGYRNHPAVKEFRHNTGELWNRLVLVREEMLKRGYHPKCMPPITPQEEMFSVTPWQTLETQQSILRAKPCSCLKERMTPDV